MKSRIVLLLSVVLFAGCPAVDTRELNFTRSKPRIEDLVGAWTPDKESSEMIRTEGHYGNINPKIVLRADGTYSITDMPDWWSSATGQSTGKTESFDGQWKLQQRKEIWDVWVIGLQTLTYWTSIHLYRQKPPYALFVGIGDPNNANAMIFDHQPNK